MDVKQIYATVNSITSQAIGNTDLTVFDNQGLVSLGRTLLDSQTYTETWLNVLVQRIGRTIISYRQYRNKFSGLLKDEMEWGGIVQKIKVSMPNAVEDPSYTLTDGETVDQYTISKPKATQKLFITESPYMFYVTIQRDHLKTAFTNDNTMGSFLSAVYGEVQNKIELALETLGRNTVGNMIAETHGTTREINLLANYNAATNRTVKASEALYDEHFLRYAIGEIKKVSNRLTDMSDQYNDGTETRHTPKELQKMYVVTDFESALETQVEYSAFHNEYVQLKGFEEVSFWQAQKSPMSVEVNRASDNNKTTVSGVVAVLFDKDACGMFKQDEWTYTTPFNAKGSYANTYWHEKQLWFNDTSENFVSFIIADSE